MIILVKNQRNIQIPNPLIIIKNLQVLTKKKVLSKYVTARQYQMIKITNFHHHRDKKLDKGKFFSFDDQKENLINCPKCEKIITRSSRYDKQIKNSLIWLNQQKEDQIKKYNVTNDKILNAIDLVNQKLQFVKNKKLKDKDSFFDNILLKLQQENKLTNSGRDSKMTYHYFNCILKVK
ncbi:unnamed protein product [Paramecium sonneborni]|uniref:Uncharacterized protein n=1 Tax=Paramecium sonneborni TaxID=65129 RepID=A0A8S1NQL3_9CILI|nr:unnamed protein product [Paramecium sonneborni]